MIFSLEALQAKEGDALILHYGQPDSPRFIVIDGGPNDIYQDFLRPRLAQLHDQWQREDGKLHLDMVMVSHIDRDHIVGIIDWMEEIESGEAVPSNFATLWYNSFDAVLGNTASELRSRVASLADEVMREDGAASAISPLSAAVIVAGVKEGRELRERADALGILLNGGFDGLVMAEEGGRTTITRGSGLQLHVIGPALKRLEKLQEEWDKHVRKNPDPVVVAAFADRSVANLSSIVVIAELEGKRMLLTGDARGDDILDGLEAGGFLDDEGRAHFDVLKMPHHGSDRNMTLDFLERITADHYVISANGRHTNPDEDTISWICQARGEDAYGVYFTNEEMFDSRHDLDVGEVVKEVFEDHPNDRRNVIYRRDDEASVVADLLDEVTY